MRGGLNTSGVAWGYFSDDINVDGWGKLYIESNGIHLYLFLHLFLFSFYICF